MKIETFGKWNQQDIYRFWLENDTLKVGILNFGGILQSFQVKTPTGPVDIVLGPKSVEDYIRSQTYTSAVIGRVANRIEKGTYVQNGVRYQIPVNDRGHTCHGGINGFDKKVYAYTVEGETLTLSCISPDGEEGFPGNLSLQVTIRLEGNRLEIRFAAESDQDTAFAPTYHPYFRLEASDAPIYDTLLTIPATGYLPLSEGGIPTGQVCPVEGTPFDFTKEKPIGCDIFSKDAQIALVNGYDHCFAVEGEWKASAFCKNTGIRLDVTSDMPGVQLYTTNEANAHDSRFFEHGAFCLEPEFFPNALNEASFAQPILPANTRKEHHICYTIALQE